MGTVTRYIRIVTVCTVAAGLWGGRVHSQRVEPDRIVVDTMAGKEQVEKSRSLYDKPILIWNFDMKCLTQ